MRERPFSSDDLEYDGCERLGAFDCRSSVILSGNAEVAELADAPALGAGGRKAVGVRVPSSADLFCKRPVKRALLLIFNKLNGSAHWTEVDKSGQLRSLKRRKWGIGTV
jgi:hypothetical protein